MTVATRIKMKPSGNSPTHPRWPLVVSPVPEFHAGELPHATPNMAASATGEGPRAEVGVTGTGAERAF